MYKRQRHPCGAGAAHHRVNHFAAACLTVDTPFAGDHQTRLAEWQRIAVENKIGTGMEIGAQHRRQGKTYAAAGAVHRRGPPACYALPVGQRVLKFGKGTGGKTFLPGKIQRRQCAGLRN